MQLQSLTSPERWPVLQWWGASLLSKESPPAVWNIRWPLLHFLRNVFELLLKRSLSTKCTKRPRRRRLVRKSRGTEGKQQLLTEHGMQI